MAAVMILGIAATLGAARLLRGSNESSTDEDVLRNARTIPDGGGYYLQGSGVPDAIHHKNVLILPKGTRGTYCCGFTLYVAMQVAQQRGLLQDKEPRAVKQFQRHWYGTTPASAERQIVVAMESLGIGKQVDPHEARPGDFVMFWRAGTGEQSGHQVIFLEYVRHDGVIVGVRYRGSNATTDGVGDATEYFTSARYEGASIDPTRFYVARLHRTPRGS